MRPRPSWQDWLKPTHARPWAWVGLWVVASLVASWYGARGMGWIDDLSRSLADRTPAVQAMFEREKAASPFDGKIFLTDDGSRDADEARARFAALGYVEEDFMGPGPQAAAGPVWELLPHLPQEALREFLAPARLRQRAAAMAMLAALPGGSALWAQAAEDPFGTLPFLVETLTARGAAAAPKAPAKAAAAAQVTVFRRPSPIPLPDLVPLDDWLESHPRVQAIGADLFAVQNYRAVKDDVTLAMLVSLPLTLAVFAFFATHRRRMLAFLAAGSFVSYGAGFLALHWAYGEAYTLVLAFTSTFVGFNNEYLVHFSGLDAVARKRHALALGSAVGTTFIGFVALLLSPSPIIRQIAVVSLGGMVGFLAFMASQQSLLTDVRFRPWTWRAWRFRPLWLLPPLLALGAALWWWRPMTLATDIADFRYQSSRLAAMESHFTAMGESAGFGPRWAVPTEDALATWSQLGQAGLPMGWHPLSAYRDVAGQNAHAAFLRENFAGAWTILRDALAEKGLADAVATPASPRFNPQDPLTFLDAVTRVAGTRWWDEADGRTYLIVGLAPGARADALPAGSVALNPRVFYNKILTGLSADMGGLFLASLVVMVIFLALIHRRAGTVVAMLVPLLTAGLAVWAYLAWRGQALNFIHMMGLALIISLAIDYGTMAVATHYEPEALGKIVLTGAASLASFAGLGLASHPVLRDLGAVVLIGIAVSLITALLIRPQSPSPGENP